MKFPVHVDAEEKHMNVYKFLVEHLDNTKSCNIWIQQLHFLSCVDKDWKQSKKVGSMKP